MKLQVLAMIVFLLFPTTTAYGSRPLRRTLSAAAKKPASPAGFFSLRLDFACLSSPSLPGRQVSRASRFRNLITQTPSSL